MVLITGGAGFIGSNLVHFWIEKMTEPVINVDKLTYAGNLQSLARIYGNPRHIFVRGLPKWINWLAITKRRRRCWVGLQKHPSNRSCS